MSCTCDDGLLCVPSRAFSMLEMNAVRFASARFPKNRREGYRLRRWWGCAQSHYLMCKPLTKNRYARRTFNTVVRAVCGRGEVNSRGRCVSKALKQVCEMKTPPAITRRLILEHADELSPR